MCERVYACNQLPYIMSVGFIRVQFNGLLMYHLLSSDDNSDNYNIVRMEFISLHAYDSFPFQTLLLIVLVGFFVMYYLIHLII